MTRAAPKLIHVQAGDGRTVRLLDGRTLKPGEASPDVPRTLYIQRRLDCGDLVDVTDEAPAETAAPAPIAAPASPNAATSAAASAPAPAKAPAAQTQTPAAPTPAPDASKGIAP